MCTKKELMEQVDFAIEKSKNVENKLAQLVKDSEEILLQSKFRLMLINSSIKF